jgi:hypothetical protein
MCKNTVVAHVTRSQHILYFSLLMVQTRVVQTRNKLKFDELDKPKKFLFLKGALIKYKVLFYVLHRIDPTK